MKNMRDQRRNATPAVDNIIRTSWKESLEWCGPYPQRYKRFFKTETLTNALEKALMERDRFFHAGLLAAGGGAPLNTVSGDIVYEDALRLVMILSLTTRARKRCSIRLVIAKNHQECSVALSAEYECLTRLRERAPERIIGVYGLGLIYLPDRHQRKEMNREVFAYFTDDIPDVAPLHVASPTQLGPRGKTPRRFSMAETEQVKCALVQLAAACYDPRSGTGLDLSNLVPEHLVWVKRRDAAPLLMLTAGGRLKKHLRPDALVQRLLLGTLKTNETLFPIAPVRPDQFLEALAAVVSQDFADAWCLAFIRKAGRIDSDDKTGILPGRDYFGALKSHIEAD